MGSGLVFNEVASRLKVLANGNYAGQAVAIKVKEDGTLDLGTMTVQATNLDIRHLNYTDDVVTVKAITDTVTVQATDLDIRHLNYTDDVVTVKAITDTVTVQATDLDIRNLNYTDDVVTVKAITDTVTVQATNLDIRHLNSTDDTVTVASITNMVKVSVENPTFEVTPIDYSDPGTDVDGNFYLPTGVSDEQSYFVMNLTGSNPLTVTLELSPDNTNWVADPNVNAIVVAANSNKVLEPSMYAPYTRLSYACGGLTCKFKMFGVANKAVVA